MPTLTNKDFDAAVQQGIADAAKTVQNIRSAWVKDQEVVVDNGKVSTYRVNLNISFVIN